MSEYADVVIASLTTLTVAVGCGKWIINTKFETLKREIALLRDEFKRDREQVIHRIDRLEEKMMHNQ